MKKIDLKKIKELEVTYCTTQSLPGDINITSDLSLYTLQRMMRIVLDYDNSSYSCAPENVKLAFETLKSLGVIVEEGKTDAKIQQLNS